MTYVGISPQTQELLSGNNRVKDQIDAVYGDSYQLKFGDPSETVEIVSENSLLEQDLATVFKAVEVGFEPTDVLTYIGDENVIFQEVNMKEYTNTENEFHRQKGRVIGRNGKTKDLIEEYTGVQLSISGKHVGIIGRQKSVVKAREAICMLLSGAPHSSVYGMLEDFSSWRNHPIRAWTPPGH